MRRGTQYGLDSDPEEDWRLRAACRDYDPELWFPVSEKLIAARPAKQVCRRCPVRRECLEEGQEEAFGVWGGKTPRERCPEPPRKHPLSERDCESCGAEYRPNLPTHRRCLPCRTGGFKPCGTIAAYHRHLARGEVACPACKEARRVESSLDRQRRAVRR